MLKRFEVWLVFGHDYAYSGVSLRGVCDVVVALF